MFRAISSAARHEVMSLIVGCFGFLALLLLGGFLLPRCAPPSACCACCAWPLCCPASTLACFLSLSLALDALLLGSFFLPRCVQSPACCASCADLDVTWQLMCNSNSRADSCCHAGRPPAALTAVQLTAGCRHTLLALACL